MFSPHLPSALRREIYNNRGGKDVYANKVKSSSIFQKFDLFFSEGINFNRDYCNDGRDGGVGLGNALHDNDIDI